MPLQFVCQFLFCEEGEMNRGSTRENIIKGRWAEVDWWGRGESFVSWLGFLFVISIGLKYLSPFSLLYTLLQRFGLPWLMFRLFLGFPREVQSDFPCITHFQRVTPLSGSYFLSQTAYWANISSTFNFFLAFILSKVAFWSIKTLKLK